MKTLPLIALLLVLSLFEPNSVFARCIPAKCSDSDIRSSRDALKSEDIQKIYAGLVNLFDCHARVDESAEQLLKLLNRVDGNSLDLPNTKVLILTCELIAKLGPKAVEARTRLLDLLKSKMPILGIARVSVFNAFLATGGSQKDAPKLLPLTKEEERERELEKLSRLIC